jgi:integrase
MNTTPTEILTDDPRVARQIAKAANVIGQAVAAGALSQGLIHRLVVGASLTVEQAVNEWAEWLRSTCGSDRTADNHLMFVRAWMRDAHVTRTKIAAIKEQHISNWINASDRTKMSSRCVKLAAVRSLFRFCEVRQYTMGDPAQLVRVKAKLLTHEQKEPRQKTCFTDAQVTQITNHLWQRLNELTHLPIKVGATRHKLSTVRFWYCAVIIGRYAGLRLGDICSLEWSCLSKPGKLIVWTDKRDRRVELDVTPELKAGLDGIAPNKRKLCFPEQDEILRSSKRYKLSIQFMRILDALKIEGHSFHDFRHTRLSELVRNGMSLTDAAAVAGHTSTKTTQGYIHNSDGKAQ